MIFYASDVDGMYALEGFTSRARIAKRFDAFFEESNDSPLDLPIKLAQLPQRGFRKARLIAQAASLLPPKN